MKKFRAAIALALVLSFVFSVVSSGASENVKNEADCPYVFIHGFMGSSIYTDPTDENSPLAWPPAGGDIAGAVFRSLPSLFALMITHDYKRFADKVLPVVDALFETIELPPDGAVHDKSGVRWSYPPAESIDKSSRLSFVYDWRISPIEVAAQLNDFIDYVLECSGASQIVAQAHSYGGVILTTYARLYGTSKIRSWAYNSTAVFGEDYTGDLFNGNLVFRDYSLTEFLKAAVEYSDSEKFLDSLFDFLYKTKITDGLCRLVNRMIEKIGMERVSQSLVPLFGGWLSIWSMIPDDKAESAYDYVFDFVYKNDPTDRSGLQAKIKEYDEKIRPFKAETLRQIDKDANLYVMARYGYYGMFMTDSWVNESDTIIDTKYASFGAVCAPHGEKLSEEQKKDVEDKYISPGGSINASSCMFPEQTWFIKGLTHSKESGDIDEFFLTLLYHDGQATVETFDEYPRWLLYRETDGKIVPDK